MLFSSISCFNFRWYSAHPIPVLAIALLFSVGCGQPYGAADRKAENDRSRISPSIHEVNHQSLPDAESVQLAHVRRRNDQQMKLLDPSYDGWESERFAEVGKKRLLGLIQAHMTGDALSQYANSGAVARGIGVGRGVAFEQPGIRVYRAASSPTRVAVPLSDGLTQLLGPLQKVGSPKFQLKVIRVDLETKAPTTVVLYEAFAVGNEGAIQQTARLTCRWNRSDQDQLKLSSLDCDDLEQVVTEAAEGRWFDDCTAAVMSEEPAFHEQFVYGLNHWIQRVERAHQMDDSVRNGLAIGDANGDGLDDVYVCQGPGLTNRLLIQNVDGTVSDNAHDAGVDWLDQTSSALFVDLDNDSDQDLAIATFGGLLVMENNGSGTFSLQAHLGSHRCDAQSLSAADYDNDGDLDLYLCVYRPDHLGRRGDFVFHNATTGGRNYLFQNDIQGGEWSFRDVASERGLDDGANRYSLAASWEDYDQDGDQDLYVANDYGPNELFRNQSGNFSRVTTEAGLADTGFGMSVSWGDVNRDGKMDLYIGNMFSSAGNRITRQSAFQKNTTTAQRAIYQRMAQGNSLFQQEDNGTFRELSQLAGVNMGRWAWSSIFADLNNDSWEDLIVANGYITTEETGDL